MSETLKQNIESGDNSRNNIAGGDLLVFNGVYNDFSREEENDFKVINEIFDGIISKLDKNDELLDKKQIDVTDKIELNFPDQADKETVRFYLEKALLKVSLIDARIKEEDPEIQSDLQSHIFGRYRKLKSQKKSNIQILEDLFDQFIIPGKSDNCRYTNIAKAFVLFFFEDCTIFEKTKSELEK